jgi:hypothetical protein
MRATLQRAIDDLERDVDMMTSSEVQALRSDVERLVGRLRQAWAAADWVRLARLRVHAVGIDFDGLAHAEQLLAALAYEAEIRTNLVTKVAEAGLTLRVPATLDLDLPQHPNREGVSEAVIEAAKDMSDREARRVRLTKRREPDQHAR